MVSSINILVSKTVVLVLKKKFMLVETLVGKKYLAVR
jgi:hypothetical protein